MKKERSIPVPVSTHLKLALLALAFILGLFLPLSDQALANYCPGPGGSCHGYYPTAYGCTVSSSSAAYREGGNAKVEMRNSSDCDAEWARVTNVSGSSRYVAASIRFGGQNYDYHFSEDSGDPHAPIGHNELIWTAAVWRDSYIPARACGHTPIYPVTLPVGVSDYYCGYAS